MQPAKFVDRVVIASLDGSSIPVHTSSLIENRKAGRPLIVSIIILTAYILREVNSFNIAGYLCLPMHHAYIQWRCAGCWCLLMHHGYARLHTKRPKHSHTIAASKVTLPYPTGVTSIANFFKSCGNYTVPTRRRIAISLVGNLEKNELRSALAAGLQRIGGTIDLSGSRWHMHIAFKCAPEYEGSRCGIGNLSPFSNAYKRVLNTDFCLEVSGDTPTRSHFYLAVLAGCIPVIFDFNTAYEPKGSLKFEDPHLI